MAELFWDKIKGLLGFEDQNEPTKPYQPEIKPVKPEGFFQESFARAGEMLQGQQISRPASLFDVGYNIAKSNIQSIPRGISDEGIINKDAYVPVVSEAGYIGRKVAGLLEPTGQALEDVGHGGDVIRFGEQTRIPTVTKTGQELGLLGMDIATMGGAKPARTLAKDVYRGTMDWLAEPPPSEAFQFGAIQGGRPAVGALGKPTGATEYPVTPEANQIIAAERQAARVGPRQPAQPPAFRDPRFKAPVDPETGMYSPVEEALLNLRHDPAAGSQLPDESGLVSWPTGRFWRLG
jgi:hypothetical protein